MDYKEGDIICTIWYDTVVIGKILGKSYPSSYNYWLEEYSKGEKTRVEWDWRNFYIERKGFTLNIYPYMLSGIRENIDRIRRWEK